MADQPGRPYAATAAPPLVGRERELAILREALTAALAGRGSLVLIGGEAGIGKTALAEALCAEAIGRGALVLIGRCYDLSETPPPLAPLAGDEGAGPDGQAALFGRVRDFLVAAASRRPLVLVLDDLHWADPASLDLLRFLARDLAPLPVLIVAIYRAEELTRHHPLFSLLPVLVREAAARQFDLRALDDDAIHEVSPLTRTPYC